DRLLALSTNRHSGFVEETRPPKYWTIWLRCSILMVICVIPPQPSVSNDGEPALPCSPLFQGGEIGDDVIRLLGIADPGKCHFGAGHHSGRTCDPTFEFVRRPGNSRILERGGIGERRERGGLAADDTEEVGSKSVGTALLDRVADRTARKHGLAARCVAGVGRSRQQRERDSTNHEKAHEHLLTGGANLAQNLIFASAGTPQYSGSARIGA